MKIISAGTVLVACVTFELREPKVMKSNSLPKVQPYDIAPIWLLIDIGSELMIFARNSYSLYFQPLSLSRKSKSSFLSNCIDEQTIQNMVIKKEA